MCLKVSIITSGLTLKHENSDNILHRLTNSLKNTALIMFVFRFKNVEQEIYLLQSALIPIKIKGRTNFCEILKTIRQRISR